MKPRLKFYWALAILLIVLAWPNAHSLQADRTSSTQGQIFCDYNTGNQIKVICTIKWANDDIGIYHQLFDTQMPSSAFYQGYGKYFGAGRLRITTCYSVTGNMYDSPNAPCKIIAPDTQWEDYSGPVPLNAPQNVESSDYNRYNYFVVEVALASSRVTIPSGSITKARRVKIESFSGPASAQVNSSFNVDWATSDADDVSLIYKLPQDSDYKEMAVGKNGPATFSATTAGKAIFVLQALGHGQAPSWSPGTKLKLRTDGFGDQNQGGNPNQPPDVEVNITSGPTTPPPPPPGSPTGTIRSTIDGPNTTFVNGSHTACTKSSTQPCTVVLDYTTSSATAGHIDRNSTLWRTIGSTVLPAGSQTDADPSPGTYTYDLYGSNIPSYPDQKLNSVTVTITAAPPAGSYGLTVSKTGTGSGTVTGPGINCGSDCSENFSAGTSVTLTAAPASGSTVSWSGCDSTSGSSCTVTMNASRTVVVSFNASAGTQGNCAQYVSQSVPTSMSSGATQSVSVTMQNCGSTTWTSGGGYNLGSQNPQDNFTWGLARVGVPSSVAPGASATFNFSLKAPATTGTYNSQWRMVQEGVQWFGDFTPNVAINVTSGGTGCTQNCDVGTIRVSNVDVDTGAAVYACWTLKRTSPSPTQWSGQCETSITYSNFVANAFYDIIVDQNGTTHTYDHVSPIGSQFLNPNGTISWTVYWKKKVTTCTANCPQVLNVSVSGDGSVSTVGVDWINCPSVCSKTFYNKEAIRLAAHSSLKVKWGGDCDGTPSNSDCVVVMDRSHSVTASFGGGGTPPPPPPPPPGSSGSITFSVTYTQKQGVIAVNSNISASWTIPGVGNRNGTSSADIVVPGQYNVNPQNVSGYQTPSSQTASVNADQTATVNLNYASSTGRLIVNSNISASWNITPGVGNRSGTSSSDQVSAGNYTVTPGNVNGYTTPAAQSTFVGSGDLDVINLTYNLLPLNAPTNVTISNSVCGQLTLVSWDYNSNGVEDGFKISRSTDNSNYADIQTLNRNARSFTDTPPAINQRYYYIVKAFANAPYREAAAPSVNALNQVCSANLSNSTKTLRFVNGTPYSSSLTLKDGDTLTFSITVNNAGPADATINYITDNLSTNLVNPRNLSVTGGGSNGGITGTAPSVRLNVSGNKQANAGNWVVSFDVTLRSSGTDQLETLANSAIINFNDPEGSKSKTVNFGPILFKTGKARIPQFREVAP